MRRIVSVLVLCCILAAPSVDAAQSFAYVATCGQSSNCAAPQLLVYDANTAQLVTAIDLPAGTPRNAEMALDGTRLYVSIAGSTGARLAVIDTTAHVLAGSYTAPVAGDVAVARDGSRVFVMAQPGGGPSDGIVYVFDVTTHVFAPFIAVQSLAYQIATNPARDRLYVASGLSPAHGVRAYDSITGAILAVFTPVSCLQPSTCRAPTALAVSPDGNRVYYVDVFWSATPWIHVLDAGSLQERTNLRAVGLSLAEAETHQRLYIGGNFTLSWSTALTTGTASSAVDGSIGLPALVNGVAFSRDATRTWASMFSDNAPDQVNGLAVIDTAGGTVLQTIPLPTSPTPIVATPRRATAACSYALDKTHTPWAIPGGTATIRLTTPCAWSASSDAEWARIDYSTGLGTTTFTLTVDPNPLAGTRSATLVIAGQVVTVTQAGGASTAPFGVVDTPTDNIINVAGELAVTGWALDDVGVTRVQIVRDPVAGEPGGSAIYIGDAVLVDGARSDVQAAYPAYPDASRAGWGYMLLTNMLPGGGNGTYRLTAIATDIEGRQSVLGTRTITCTNAASAAPFGTIDTPGQGQPVSGTIINFGWALTPQPKVIPFDGSTIDVVIDGVVVGHPTYGFARSDVDALFPGYANTGRAVGYFVIDTTTLTNGPHVIAWVVRDNQGATAGIGARYFTVINP